MNNKECIICGADGYQKFSGGWYCKECTNDQLDNMAEEKRELEDWYNKNGERVGKELEKELNNNKLKIKGGEE